VAGTPIDTATGSKAIEDVALGDRVGPESPACAEVSTEGWSELELRMVVESNGVLDELQIQLLRPAEWMRLHRVRRGGYVAVALDEMNVSGNAYVVDVARAQLLSAGARCPVTGLVRHMSEDVIRVDLEGGAPLEVTRQHRLFSADRLVWVEAGQLGAREALETRTGSVAVLNVGEGTAEDREVFNLEVFDVHEYFAGDWRVRVHNTYARPPLKRLHESTLVSSQLDSIRKMRTEDIVKSLSTKGDEALRVRPDGTVIQGNHRIKVLEERGYDTSKLWDRAEVIRKESLDPLD
jgi:hypothetical protein